LQPVTVMLFGGVCSLVGTVYLALLVNPLTSVLGAISLVSYLFIYTPLKRLTWLNTMVGAIPGALPPLMGWAAARGELGAGGWALFAMLAFWQLPHFFAIAWIYQEEYAKAGFKMLPAVDPDGSRSAQQSVSHTLGLLLASLCRWCCIWPEWFIWSPRFCWGDFICCAIQFARRLDVPSAKKLFFASIIYLPLLLIALVANKL
jgi:protoheme IX farnesyltransferase